MKKTSGMTTTGLVLAAGLLLGAAARADEWDIGNDTDNAFTTDNEPSHGAEQVHDMAVLTGGVADQDWYLATGHPFSSYEFVVDGLTGDLDFINTSVQRLTNDGTSVQNNASLSVQRGALVLNWLGPTSVPEASWVRVRNAACGTFCGPSDRYRARFHDTTYTIPRFNNSGTQATVLLLQNATDRFCDITAYFLRSDGLVIATFAAGTVTAHRLLVVPGPTIAPNESGSVRVAHTCGYGGLTGKAVSIEPSTGFTFDTALQHRP